MSELTESRQGRGRVLIALLVCATALATSGCRPGLVGGADPATDPTTDLAPRPTPTTAPVPAVAIRTVDDGVRIGDAVVVERGGAQQIRRG